MSTKHRLGDYVISSIQGMLSIHNAAVNGAQPFVKLSAEAEIASPVLLEQLVRQRMQKRLIKLALQRDKLQKEINILNREEQSLIKSLGENLQTL